MKMLTQRAPLKGHAVVILLCVCLTPSSVFPFGYLSHAGVWKDTGRKEAAPLICSLTYRLKAGAARKCFFHLHPTEDGLRGAWLWSSPHHTPRVSDHPSPRVQKPTGHRKITDRARNAWLNFTPALSSLGSYGFCACVYRLAIPIAHPWREISIVWVAAHFMLRFPHLFPDLQSPEAGVTIKRLHPHLLGDDWKEGFVFQKLSKHKKQTLLKVII